MSLWYNRGIARQTKEQGMDFAFGDDTITIEELRDSIEELLEQTDLPTEEEWAMVQVGHEIVEITGMALDDLAASSTVLVRDDHYGEFAEELANENGLEADDFVLDAIDWDVAGDTLVDGSDEITIGYTTYAIVEGL
jgi:hypothetical protein